MNGNMQLQPLLVSALIEHAARNHPHTEIVSRTVEGELHRYTYRDAAARAKRLANALRHLGIQSGERVGTLAWNGYRHLEIYYGVSGMGAVAHTINPRLFPEQIAWIVNHAEDIILCFDLTFVPLVEALADKLPSVRAFVVMTDREHMPAARIPHLVCYEDLIATEADDFVWPLLDENTACGLCYTSGTTGNPKGVLYSHRSTVLHTYGAMTAEAFNVTSRDAILPVVPMFHVNAWGIPYIAPAIGAKLVFPGPALDGASLYSLFEGERVTLSAGVPTVWMGLLAYVNGNGLRFSTFRETVIGGSACPPAMIRSFEQDHNVNVVHAWGMTELSPLGSMCRLREQHSKLPPDAQFAIKIKQGAPNFGVEMKIVDDDGRALPHDGIAFGNLMVRGPWIVERYFREERSALIDGWFPTGDVATIDADGYMQITDRSKDVIKSGGEWISSIDLENIAVAHPDIAEAAVIGVAHPKWDERPLLLAVRKPGADITREALLAFYEGKVAKWMIPDDAVFVDALPHTATGKLHKVPLRQRWRNHLLARG